MSLYTGTAKLTYDGKTRDVLLSLDLNEYCLVAKHPQDNDPFQYVVDRERLWSLSDLCLTDVNIPTANGTLWTTKVDELFIATYSPGASSIHDSMLNRSFQISNDSAGIVTIKLMPAQSIVEFDYTPLSGNLNELFYVANFASFPPFSCDAGGVTYRAVEKRPNLSVQSSAPLWTDERRIRLAFSLLQGAPIFLLAGYEEHKARINLLRPRVYQPSHRLYDHYKDAPDVLDHLLRFSMALSMQDFHHWEKAAGFLLEGKASYAEADIRVTNLFVFIEMFDESRTLSGNSLSAMMSISLSDAKFLCEVRNRLVHEKHDLSEAIRDAQSELICHDPSHVLTHFDISGHKHPATTNLLIRLCERLNFYVAQQIGWNGTWNAYKSIL